jgi:hypothetical protein
MKPVKQPIAFRIPPEYRSKYESKMKSKSLTEGELAKQLVIKGLVSEENDIEMLRISLKNILFLTQITSEVLKRIEPDNHDAIMENCKLRTAAIYESMMENIDE